MKSSSIDPRTLGIAVFILFAGCDTGRTQSRNRLMHEVGGTNWISADYLDALDRQGTPAAVGGVPCLELVFSAAFDSVAVFDGGHRKRTVPVSAESDTAFMAAAFGDAPSRFVLAGGRSLVVSGGGTTRRFRRLEKKYAVRNVDGWLSGSELFLNERMFAGEYFLLNPDGEPSSVVALSAYGKVSGLANYDRYAACYTSGCLPGDAGDGIELSGGGATDRYAWAWQHDTLVFYSVMVQGRAREQMSRGPEIFRFVKKR